MFRKALIIIMALALFAPAAQAAGKDSFWQRLKSRIQGISPKKKATVTTAVGGVRGALSDEADSVYWKGKEVNEIDEEELMKFNGAISMAEQGDKAAALEAFESFLDEYPDSQLRLDALEAVATLKPEVEDTLPPGEPEEAPPVAAEDPAVEEPVMEEGNETQGTKAGGESVE
jgi:hypothetical protein